MQVATHLLQYVLSATVDSGFSWHTSQPQHVRLLSYMYIQFWEGVLQMKKAGFRYYMIKCTLHTV